MIILLVLFIFILYIYLFEQKMRHFLESIKADIVPFNNKFLLITQKISNRFKNNVWYSNLIFLLGGVLSILLLLLDAYKHFPLGALLTGVGFIVFLLSSFIATSISGKTWINGIYNWAISPSKEIPSKILKGIMFELLLVYPALLFIIMVMFVLFAIISGSYSPMNIIMLVYALPIFAALWVYRFNDYNEHYDFQLNIRRLIIYLIVAVVYLLMKNPNSLFVKQSIEHRLDSTFLDIVVVVFITLDRVGKVIIEILRGAKKATV